jgi:hypothetical protein
MVGSDHTEDRFILCADALQTESNHRNFFVLLGRVPAIAFKGARKMTSRRSSCKPCFKFT